MAVDKAPDAFRTISEVAEELDLPQHVLRFWETRFSQIRPMKRGGGRRYYRPDDVDLLRGIRHLLYGEGYTIRGVQRILKDHGVKFVQSVWQAGAPQPAKAPGDADEAESVARDERGRRLFALLPSLLGSEDHAESDTSDAVHGKPPIEDLTALPSPGENGDERLRMMKPSGPRPQRMGHARDHDAAAGGLTREDVRKLQAMLAELAECRQLLDAVLAEKP
jgi:DNA-binding transcriptional MerR regulator